ncbi:MAG: response regulator transcription factor [Thermodesulfobacteriota bacterium]|nr:response regulator transcription factor [Thermodesulfobacteriota bacterium]
MKILIVEDDKGASRFIQKGLSEAGFTTDTSFDGEEGLFLASTRSYDLIILDIMLPALNGFEIIKRLRNMEIVTPVIFLTAKDSQADIVQGLDLGADDYLVKPFAFAELYARIKAVLRRGIKEKQSDTLCLGDLSLDLITRTARRNGDAIDLSAKEFLLLVDKWGQSKIKYCDVHISKSLIFNFTLTPFISDPIYLYLQLKV